MSYINMRMSITISMVDIVIVSKSVRLLVKVVVYVFRFVLLLA